MPDAEGATPTVALTSPQVKAGEVRKGDRTMDAKINYKKLYATTVSYYYRLNRNRGFLPEQAQRVAEFYAKNWIKNTYGLES